MQFITGAWRNTRFTHPTSSVLLGLVPVLIVGFGAFPQLLLGGNLASIGVAAILLSLQVLAYPLARETYFRLTEPIRRGLGPLILIGPLFFVYWGFRLGIYIGLTIVAIPLGAVGFFYLATTEHTGRGWRTS